MAKRPAAGRTKTRLIPHLTPDEAARFYECSLLDTLGFLTARDDCTPIIAIDAPGSAQYFLTVAPGLAQVLQVGDTLGDRLDAVLRSCLDQGFDEAWAIGSDSPDLPPSHLNDAFALLGGGTADGGARTPPDVVLGPADDGGYYLIGWRAPWSQLVTEVTMSTPTVLADTLAIGCRDNIDIALGEPWHDVDEPEDLERLRASIDPALLPHTAEFFAHHSPAGAP